MAMTDAHAQGFNIYQWDAPCYETPEKVVAALYNADIQGKELERIHVPGLGTDREGDYYYRGEKHPFCLWFHEPLQLIFRDGTTLEILPLYNGGARIGRNSLPVGVKSRVNKTTWDLKSLLSLTLFQAKVGSRDPFRLERAQRSTYNAYPGEKKGYMSRKWTENILEIYLNNDQKLELYTRDRDHSPEQYRLRILEKGEVVQLPTQRWMAAMDQSSSIELIPGPGMSCNVRFLPMFSSNPNKGWKTGPDYRGSYTLSMDVDACAYTLGSYLYEYFDPSIQKEQYSCEKPRFDWYGVNLYTMEAAYSMLHAIRLAADRMEKNPSDPALRDFADRMSVTVLSNAEYYAGVSEDEERRRKILVAADLYRRFALCMQDMLDEARKDGCDILEIYGP